MVTCFHSLQASNGLKAAGYQYVNIDDCWQVARFPNKTIQPDPKNFPDMKQLISHVHSKGLKFGLYSDSGKLHVRRDLDH